MRFSTSGDERKLRTLVHLLTKGEASRSISQLIRDTVNETYDLFQDTAQDAWYRVPRFKPLDAAELAATLEELRAADLPEKRMAKARDEDAARAELGDWDEFLAKGLATKVAQDELKFYNKPIPDSAVAIYRRLIEHVKAELVGRVASQTEATYELLADVPCRIPAAEDQLSQRCGSRTSRAAWPVSARRSTCAA